jgi:hypothetical protein
VRKLAAKVRKPELTDDSWRPKILEFGSVSAGLGTKANEQLCTLEAAVMVGGNVGDKISGMVQADGFLTQLQSRH